MIVQREHFFKVIEELESYPFPISFDSETSGLEFCDTMFSLSVATSNSSYYFNFNPNKDCFGNLPCDSKILPEEYKQYIPNIFRNKPYCFAHNAKFDLLQLRKENIILPQDARIYDTLILAVLYNNTYQNYSLDYLSKKFLAKEKDDIKSFMVKNKLFTKTTKKSSKKEEKKYLFDKVPLNIMAEYAEKDAKLTLELGEFLLSLINERDESSSFPNKVIYVANSESDLLNVLVDIEYRGIRLDIDHINKSIEICTKKIEELDNRFLEISGKKFDNKRDTIVDALTGDGVSLSINEDTGIFKTNKSNLVKSDSEIASLIVERRCIDTELKYLHSYMDYCIGDVVHPIYNTGKGSDQYGARTGRMSCSSPNLQNIKKDYDQTNSSIRRCFIPREGYLFAKIDYEQQEYRMMLDYSGQKNVIANILDGQDIHSAVAEMVGVTRSQAKTLNFAILYGAGIDKIASMLSISKEDAKDFKKKYFDKLPSVKKFIKNVISAGENRLYVVNCFGRILRITSKEYAYKLPNHLIQSGCADVVKQAMIKVYDYIKDKDASIVLQVHDEIVLEMRENRLEMLNDIKEIMENIYKPRNGLKLTTSCDINYLSLSDQGDIKWTGK